MSKSGPRIKEALLGSVVVFAVLIAFSSSPVQAASVTFSITVTLAEPGAPSFVWTITGCSASPSSGTSGTAQVVTMNSGCPYTIGSAGTKGNGTLRDRFTSGYVSSVSGRSCSSGTCASVTITAHAQEYLSVSQSCSSPTTSVASPTSDSWYNYGTTLSVSCHGVWNRSGGAGLRATSWNWDGGTNTKVSTAGVYTSSARILNSHHVFNVNKVTQYQLGLDAGATSALLSLTNPTIMGDSYWYDSGTPVTYVGSGIFGRANGVGNRSISWSIDSSPPTLLSATGGFNVATTMSGPHLLQVATVSQVEITLDTTTSRFLLEITPPTLTNDNYWYDVGTPVTIALAGVENRGGGTDNRLVSYSLNSGGTVPTASTGTVFIMNSTPITSKEFVTATSTTQYQLTLDSVSALSLASVTPPSIPGDNYWYDSGTGVVLQANGVFGRSSGIGSRVTSWWVDENPQVTVVAARTFTAVINMYTPHAVHMQSTTQYQISLTGYNGIPTITAPTIQGDDYWYDGGTKVSLSLPEEFGRAGGTGWRMSSYSVDGGIAVEVSGAATTPVFNALTVSSPHSVAVSSVRQYQVTLDLALSQALRSISPPTIPGDDYWYDAGSTVDLSVDGVWGRNSSMGFRLVSISLNGTTGPSLQRVATTGIVGILELNGIEGAQFLTSNSTIQYQLAVNGGIGQSTNPSPPIAGDRGWYDSGTVVIVSTNGTFSAGGQTRERVTSWSVDGGVNQRAGASSVVTVPPIYMNRAHAVIFNTLTQYLVTVLVRDSTGADTLTPQSILLEASGGTVVATSGVAWVDANSNVSASTIIWQGLDVAPTNAVHYVVNSPLEITVDSKVYNAVIDVKDSLGFGVGGASATITLVNGTTIQSTANGDGVISLHLIPLGPFQATISSLGLSTNLTGDASTEGLFTAHILLGVTSLIVIALGAIILIVVFLVVRRIIGNWRLNRFFSHAGDETPVPRESPPEESPTESGEEHADPTALDEPAR